MFTAMIVCDEGRLIKPYHAVWWLALPPPSSKLPGPDLTLEFSLGTPAFFSRPKTCMLGQLVI